MAKKIIGIKFPRGIFENITAVQQALFFFVRAQRISAQLSRAKNKMAANPVYCHIRGIRGTFETQQQYNELNRGVVVRVHLR